MKFKIYEDNKYRTRFTKNTRWKGFLSGVNAKEGRVD